MRRMDRCREPVRTIAPTRWCIPVALATLASGACGPSRAPRTSPPEAAVDAGASSAGDAAESIGSATMEADGTIVMQLRAEGPGGIVGDAQFVYPPSHPEYREILRRQGRGRRSESQIL